MLSRRTWVETERARRLKQVLLAAAVSGAVAGCGDSAATDEPRGTADCSAQVRLGGVVYTSYGYTDRAATRFAEADEVECHDVGADAAGSVFTDDPRQVAVWAIQGYPTAQVVGVRRGAEKSLAVFVAESVPERHRDRIFRELTP